MFDLQSPVRLGMSKAQPTNVTILPKATKPTAGSFSRLNIECDSICIYARPGKTYANGIAANKP